MFCKQIRERRLKSNKDTDLNLVNIMDQFTPSIETHLTLSISFLLVIGAPRSGVKSKSLPSCRQDITPLILPTAAGLQPDAVFSSLLESMVSSMSGISIIDKMRSRLVKRSVTALLLPFLSTKTWLPSVMPKVQSSSCSSANHWSILQQKKRRSCNKFSREKPEEKKIWKSPRNFKLKPLPKHQLQKVLIQCRLLWKKREISPRTSRTSKRAFSNTQLMMPTISMSLKLVEKCLEKTRLLHLKAQPVSKSTTLSLLPVKITLLRPMMAPTNSVLKPEA